MRDAIKFIVGSETRLKDILAGPDVVPFLNALIDAGADAAAVADEKLRILWSAGDETKLKHDDSAPKETSINKPICHEGETIGFLSVSFPETAASIEQAAGRNQGYEKSVMDMAASCLNVMIKNTVKRMLTTELHTTVVQQSYDELIETNKRLTASEKRYRELSETLEQKVEQRTAELKKAHAVMLQQEKMASIGQLAAGIAHEINNPIGFINSNINTLNRYITNLAKMIQFYKQAGRGGDMEDAEALYQKLKIGYILEDMSPLISQSLEGAVRIKNIVSNLKDFSHIDESDNERTMDINAEIDNTINVLAHEIASRSAEIVKDYGNISGFFGNPGLICHALLNVIMNALQSRTGGLRITVRTRQDDDKIMISISDNGRGIPPEIRSRIFDPFFSTKEIGMGTGMGLTVVYEIVSSYKGTIDVESETGKGTTIIIALPLDKKVRTDA